MAFTGILPSSSRRDIIIVATVICLLTVIISFRTLFASQEPWQPPVGELPEFGNGKHSPVPTPDHKDPKQKEVSSATTTTSAYMSTATSTIVSAPTSLSQNPVTGGCDNFPDTKDILLVMKTGATEAYDKLPIHFMTTLKCINDSIIVSDMEMNMAGHHLIDVLDEVKDDIKEGNGDWDLYRTLQQFHKLREDPRQLKGQSGWNLDKYKFLHLLLRTHRYRPDAPWYIFVEADTTLIWDNVRTFLDKYNPDDPLYFGSPTYLDIEFAHGGTGYIWSREAMKRAVGDHLDIAEHYDKDVHSICCGDRMIGRVLLDVDIHLTRAWPLLNGEKPSTIPYSKSHWCQPVLSMHHLTAQEVSQIWNYEQERRGNGTMTPLIFMDLFNYFVKDNMAKIREDWNNLSGDFVFSPPPDENADKLYNGQKWTELTEVQQASPGSHEDCKHACEVDSECWQWAHHDRECRLDRRLKLGGSKSPENGKKWVSGWMLDRIDSFREERANCPTLDWTMKGPSGG